MTRCITEKDLILHYYGELSDRDETRVASHVRECQSCHASFARLTQALDAVHDLVVEPGPGFERHVWARVEPRLEPRDLTSSPRPKLVEGRRRQWWPRIAAWSPRRWALASGLATLVVAAFLAGRFLPGGPAAPGDARPEQVRERVLLVAVGDHLERSQMVLVELVTAHGNGEVSIASEQARAEDLLAAGRIYRATAQRVGDAEVAALLEELERTLVEIVTSPSELPAAQLSFLRERIEAKDLLFKLRVVNSRVRDRQQEMQRVARGAIS